MKKLVLSSFTLTLFVHVVWCQAPEPACGLNVPPNLTEMYNECVDVKEEVKEWRTLPRTLCCQDAITILSKALAQSAKNGTLIFMREDQWRNCRKSFGPPGESCGFDNLLYGRSDCSTVDFSSFGPSNDKYRNALERCSHFSTNTSFDSACNNCSKAILDLRKQLLSRYVDVKNNDTEKTICGLAALISIAAGKNSSQSSDLDNMFRCFPELKMLATESGYIKVKDSLAKALLAILAASMGLMLIILLIKYVTKDKDKEPAKAKELSEKKWSGLYRFSKAEIEKAISSANERTSLGRGSAGQVFKGVLPSGQPVAIKHIYRSKSCESFTREVEGLSRIRHPNLVCLFGCCVEDGDMYLVYEFCAAGNLAYHLKNKVLCWERRCKILRDCALALRFLHNYIDGCIVHRDIKLTNILLTEELEPKLSDFGLAKMLGMEESKVFTDVRGTIGYMDPEYMTNAKLTSASDIYSFGIVALQLLSGQKVIDLDLDARDQLTRKAKDVNSGKRPLKDFEDPNLKGEVVTEDFRSILQVAVLCAAKSHKGRPSIDQIFKEMDRAWKNTAACMSAKEGSMHATTSYSESMEEMVSV